MASTETNKHPNTMNDIMFATSTKVEMGYATTLIAEIAAMHRSMATTSYEDTKALSTMKSMFLQKIDITRTAARTSTEEEIYPSFRLAVPFEMAKKKTHTKRTLCK